METYEVNYDINHIKEYQIQNQQHFYVYNEIRKFSFDFFEYVLIPKCL